MNRATAIKYRKCIEQAAANLPDDDAYGVPEIFPHWKVDVSLAVDDRICYKDKLYRVVQAHTTQIGWEPDITPALFTEVPAPGQIQVWKRPTGSHDTYKLGDKVLYPDKNGTVWVSLYDGNAWEPGVYGWEEVK